MKGGKFLNKEYEYFCLEMNKLIGLDLMKYKEEQMIRRLTNYMRKHNISGFKELVDELRRNGTMLSEMENYLTINVSEFLRNERFWMDLVNKIIPTMPLNKKVKIWSAACSSGQEPYTIAILLKEKFPAMVFEIIATDIDKEILEVAMKGEYKKMDLEVLGKGLIAKYFDKLGENRYKIKPFIRELVKFERHNLLRDNYKKDIDVIICRNVMIYFKEEVKTEIFKGFSDSLVKGGILFIGATEQLYFPQKYNFEMLQSFFYRKIK